MQHLQEVIDHNKGVRPESIRAIKKKLSGKLLNGYPQISLSSLQKKPYTVVMVRLLLKKCVVRGVGFSKVCKPDAFSPEKGLLIATDYALNDLVAALVEHDVTTVQELKSMMFDT